MFLIGDDYQFIYGDFIEWCKDLVPLFQENHAETGFPGTTYNPDYYRYTELARAGYLDCFIILHRPTSKPVGVALFILDMCLQQKELLSASQSLNYVTKEHRGAAYPFMKFCDDILIKRGVNVIWRQSTTEKDIGKVYERMGYSLSEKLYLRRL